jgi:hypothetical protein
VIPQSSPMWATLVLEPLHRLGCVYEEKVDDWRILAYKDGRSRLPGEPEAALITAGAFRRHWLRHESELRA